MFTQATSTNTGHPIRLSATSNGTHASGSQYTSGWTTTGTPGSSGASSQFIVPANAPNTLYYYCQHHSGMGGASSINVADSNSGIILTYGTHALVANSTVSGEYTIATTFDGTTSNLYVDGDLITQTTPTIASGAKMIKIGEDYNGFIKNLKFWNYAKSFLLSIMTISFKYCPGGATSQVSGDSNQVECYIYSESTGAVTSGTPFKTWGPQNDNTWNDYSGTFTPPSAGNYRLVWKLTTGNHVPDTGWDDVTFGDTTWDFESGNDGFKYYTGSTLDVSSASDWDQGPYAGRFTRTNGSTSNGGILISQQSPQSYYIWYDGSGDNNNNNIVHWIISPIVST